MDVREISALLNSMPGVHKAVVPDNDVINEVFRREASIEDTTFGMPMDNRALKTCMKRSLHVVIFCDYVFELPTDHVMTMEDCDGNLVGYDIPVGKQEEYIDRTDIVWLSDDFVLLTGVGDIDRVVMLPQKATCIGCAEGVSDPVIFYPATTTDIFLKDVFGMDKSTPSIASALISFNPL